MSKHEEDNDMCVIKTSNCKSTSGKSTLTYQIGCLPDNTVHIRISKNSAAGFVNRDWIAVTDIQKTLAIVPEGKPLTSFLLQPLFKGKSSNSPGFLMSVLSTLGLTRALKGKTRGHELLDPEGFDAKMDKLVPAKSTTGGITKKAIRKTTAGTTKRPTKKAGGNAAVKKKVASRRKTSKTG